MGKKKKNYICKDCQIKIKGFEAFNKHLLTFEHQQSLHKNALNEKRQKCGIHVTGFPALITEEILSKIFSAYGKVVDAFISPGNSFAHIQFDNENDVQKVLANNVSYLGNKLSVKPRIITAKKQLVSCELILDIIGNCQDFNCQVSCLHKKLQLPLHEMDKKYGTLCTELGTCLQKALPVCSVWAFGSTVTGLSFAESDVDVYVQVSRPVSESDSAESKTDAYIKCARSALSKSKLFSHIVAIPKAKTPIIKCVHVYTGIHCDLNFKNMLGVCNTKLIKYLLSSDKRLRSLAFLIKCWAKVNDISGTGKITNYALVMLVIFYLQQNPNAILPPIAELQLPEYENIQEGWNGGFCMNSKNLPPTQNKLTIPQLLQGFFKFYSKFEFGFTVISPFSGCCYTRFDFAHPENLPDIFSRYKNMIRSVPPLKIDTVVCVQDPFELAHNITSSTSPYKLECFQQLCKNAACICTETLAKSQEVILLKRLFVKEVPIPKDKLINKTYIIKIFVGKFCSYANTKIEPDAEDKLNVLRKFWFDEVHSFLKTVLTKALLIEMCAAKESAIIKSQKLDGQSDIHDINIWQTLTYNCTAYINVTGARKNIQKSLNLSSELKFLDREIEISKHIQSIVQCIQSKKPLFTFQLIIQDQVNPSETEIILKDTSQNTGNFIQVAHFLAANLQNWYNKYVSELMPLNKTNTSSDARSSLNDDSSDLSECSQEAS